MPRLPDIVPEKLDAEQRRVYHDILNSPRGVVQGPLRVWVNSPGLADRAQALGAFCRYDTCLEPRLSELAIIVTGAYWRAGFEWHVHAPIAVKAGIDPRCVEAIRRREKPAFEKADEGLVHDFARELLDDKFVSAATYKRAREVLGERLMIDLVGILGYYGLICMTINAFEVPVPEPDSDPFMSVSRA
jgi:4-carboxymuconolactone decarboxylase